MHHCHLFSPCQTVDMHSHPPHKGGGSSHQVTVNLGTSSGYETQTHTLAHKSPASRRSFPPFPLTFSAIITESTSAATLCDFLPHSFVAAGETVAFACLTLNWSRSLFVFLFRGRRREGRQVRRVSQILCTFSN